MGTAALRPQARVSPMDGRGPGSSSTGVKADAGATFALDKEGLDLALARRAPAPIEGLFASVPMSRRHGLSRFGFEAAPHISAAPRGAYVVVVLDASRSMTPGQASAEVAAAGATLAHLPDAHVEVLTFDRAVHARHHRFVPVAAAIAGPRRADRGSAQREPLRRRARPGGRRSSPGPRRARRARILALTDLRTRSSLTPEKAAGIVKSGAVLHIGLVEEADPKLTRDDDHPWAGVARATKGLLWQASASAPPIDAPEMRRVYEEWARPMRVHHLTSEREGRAPRRFSFPETLDEGEGIEDLRLPARPFTEVALTGELWAEPCAR